MPEGYDEFGPCVCFGVVKRGRPIAGLVLFNLNDRTGTLEMAVAAEDRRWMTRSIIAAVFEYAFGQARMVYVRTTEDKKHVRRIWKRLGAKEVIIEDFMGEGIGQAVLTLTKADWEREWNGRRFQ